MHGRTEKTCYLELISYGSHLSVWKILQQFAGITAQIIWDIIDRRRLKFELGWNEEKYSSVYPDHYFEGFFGSRIPRRDFGSWARHWVLRRWESKIEHFDSNRQDIFSRDGFWKMKDACLLSDIAIAEGWFSNPQGGRLVGRRTRARRSRSPWGTWERSSRYLRTRMKNNE